MKKQDFKVLKTKDLYPFPDNPFHVAEDETLSELAESIKEFGIVTPIITRPKDVEHRRDIQRTYGNPEPDRSILIIRCGCEAGEGVFRGRGENEVVT